MSQRKAYSTDLSDQPWEQIEPLLPQRRDPRGAKRRHSPRELLNAIFYITRNGGSWEALPHDFPPYKTVYDYSWKLCQREMWVHMLDALRQPVRVKAGRDAHPRIGVMDSPSAKTTEKGANEVTTPINE